MTQEEKARAYDEALKRAKNIKSKILQSHLSTESCKAVSEYIDEIIPELRESEDEKIRKALIQFLNDIKSISENGRTSWAVRKEDAEMCNSFITYLEKQKEHHIPWYDYQKSKEAGYTIIPNEEYEKLIKQKEQKPIKVYRVENEDKQKGLWRKFDGTWEPLFDMLTDGLCRNLPMEDSDLYRAEGKKWFASAPSRGTLQKWFSKRDLEELTAAGFTISEFEVTNYKKVSEFEYIFTRDSIINRTYLTVSDIYPEQKPAEWSEEDESELTAVIYCVSRAIKASKDENERNSLLSAKKWLQDKLSFRVKHLRPSWKPSEEQMEALLNAEGLVRANSYNENAKILASLYEDLKRL